MPESSIRTIAIATFSVQGSHQWNAAPDEAAGLRKPRQCRFFFRIEAVDEDADDGDHLIEPGMLAEYARSQLDLRVCTPVSGRYRFGNRSCARIARQLLASIRHARAVEVWTAPRGGGRSTAAGGARAERPITRGL